MHPTVKRLCCAFVVLLLVAGSACAGVLNGHGSALISGNHVFTGSLSGSKQLKADVDYAVFAPGVFAGALSLPLAEDPSGGTEYVYAYEVFNTGVSVTSFSVGLSPGVITATTNWGDAPSAGGVAPSSSPTLSGFFPLSDPVGTKTNVKWQYPFTGLLGTGAHSTILVFTSPFVPGLDKASFTTSSGDTNPPLTDFLPSPVPEPSTLLLAAAGACGLLAAGYMRRRRV